MKRGEVWWVDFEPAAGSEIQKTRPAVIVSNDASNRVITVPCTSNTKRLYPSNALIMVNGQLNKVMADQIMAADKSRLKRYLGTLNASDIVKIEAVLRLHLNI